MKFDLIAFDLDGTVMRDDGSISDVTLTTLHEAAGAGCLMIPATGRTLSEIPLPLRASELFRYIILSNGASVMDTSEDLEVLRALIESDKAVTLFRRLAQINLPFVAYSEGVAFCEDRYMPDMLSFYGPKGRHYAQIIENMRFVTSMDDYFTKSSRTVEKVFLQRVPEDLRAVVEKIVDEVGDLHLSSSSSTNLEINAKDVNKGAALQALATLLSIPKEKIMAVGDGENDLAMLAFAGFSVAVANAAPTVRGIASYTTVTNQDDGASKAIRKFFSSADQ